MSVRLGPFVLERPIARGGMAEVWRGVHASEQVPVAVKVLTGPRAREDAFVRALKNEIHAVARLDHPGIINIYDRGEVTADAAVGSGGRLVEGSPWFAMEMCSHGALSPRRFPLPWKTTRMLLLSLLDALAHAHARGVVHRDLKPGNVLLCAPEDPRPGLKLSDFGIAQPLGGSDALAASDAHSGTPRYMAPEQFNGKARELGPWTDLYALGCIAFQLATGEAPFSGDPLRLAVAHCHDPVPALVPAAEGFPAGFEAWVLRLLEKDPRQRFRVAADAAWALLQLTPDDDDVTVSTDWENTLRSLRPRPLYPDEEPSRSRHGRHDARDDTDAHTLGPAARVGAEHPSSDYTPAPPPGVDESTGEMPLPPPAKDAPLTAADRESPTAVARVPRSAFGSIPLAPPLAEPSAMRPPETAPTGHRRAPPPITIVPAGPVIDDDDPFAAVLAVADRDDDDDPATDPRTWAPQAPWTELLALADQQAKDDHPTIAGPFGTGSSERSRESERLERPRRVRAPAVPPPLPPSWRRPDEPLLPAPPARRLLGAGLGLYGLRQPPFVDRARERDVLWGALARAHGKDSACEDVVVVVRGPAGIGRTRLLSWFAERAAEVGAATSLFASHGPEHSAGDGVIGAFVRYARGAGLTGSALLNQLRHVMSDHERLEEDIALLANVVERSASAEATLKALPLRERHGLQQRLLAALARRRPVVLVVDDAQWGDDALAFARNLSGRAPSGRKGVVTVIAVFDEAVAERAAAAAAVDALTATPGVLNLALPPLPAPDHRRLVEELLGLEPRLADLVALRSAGNPRFAVELVGDFVQRGALELLPAGFALKRGEAAALPDDVHAAWSKRLTHVLAGLPPSGRLALELGAVLGKDGDTSEWLALCRAAGIVDADAVVAAVVDALERARYVVNEQGTVRFAHAMLRESMARLADEAGRLSSHHRLIARFLGERQGSQREHDERRARHLLAAGDLDVALPLLLSAAAAALATAGSVHAVGLVDEAFAALDRHDVKESDPRRLWAIALRARALADAGRHAEAAMWARPVKNDAPAEARVEAGRAMALAALRQGNLEDAFARYERLLADAHALPDSGAKAATIDDALLGMADGHYYRGELVPAGQRLAQALAHAEARHDDDAIALCLWSSAYVSIWQGDFDGARHKLARQQDVAKRAGLKVLAALGENALGDIARLEAHYDDASAHYDAALRVLRQSGSGKARVVEVNAALCAVHVDIDRAVARAELLLPDVERAGERVLLSLVHGILAVGAAKASDWSAVDAHASVFIGPHLAGLIDGEIGLLAEQLATIAAGAGRSERALLIGTWAREVWTALSRTDRLERL